MSQNGEFSHAGALTCLDGRHRWFRFQEQCKWHKSYQRKQPEKEVRFPPACGIVQKPYDWWPYRSGHALARRDDCHCKTPASIEPSCGICNERRDHGRFAEGTDKQSVGDIEIPSRACLAGDNGTESDHDRAEQDWLDHASPVHPQAHGNATHATAHHQQGVRERRARTGPIEVGGNVLQADKENTGCRHGDRPDRQRYGEDDPAVADFDTVSASGHDIRASGAGG